jgi:ribonucleoside-diphosphate reductase alpha chain
MTDKNIMVVKRDGSKVSYDVAKLKQSIAHAVEGTGANPLALEAKIDQFLRNGMKTSDIQKNVIQHAKQLATPQEPEWLVVAGRAMAADMWANFKLRGKSFSEVLHYNIRKNEYTKDLLKHYSEADIEEIGNYLDMDRDLAHSHSSLVTVQNKYLGKYELNQHMHMVSAMRFAQLEKPNNRVARVKEFYDILSRRKLSLATPFMSNLRKGGNVASCFILAIEDDLESIFDNVKRMAKISKSGGGIGVFLGFLRAKGSMVAGYENAAGPITQWVKIINDVAVAVNQGGKRAGAITPALPVWHNDIQDFLDMQTEHGDLRLKSYDVFPQVTVPDIFYERDKNQQPWVTFCPYEVEKKLGIDIRGKYGADFVAAYEQIERAFEEGKLKVARKIDNARDLMKLIMRSHFDTGLPYLFNSDVANEVNPNKNDPEAYGILCANLCVESYSNVVPDKYGHVCNLASINEANISSMEELAQITRTATRLLNYGIELTNNPDPITAAHNKRYRTIGIGQMGLHDYLAKNWMTFKNVDVIKDLAECIEYNAAWESTVLAEEFGYTFEAFPYSEWANGNMVKRFKEHSNGKWDWDALQDRIDKFGILNSQLTSPAPTTSTSIYQDSTATVLPAYSAFFSEDNKNGSLLVSAKYLKDNPIGYGKTFAKHTPFEIVDAVAAAQKFTDTGISMEWILDQNREGFSAKDLYDAIHYAHEKKIKTIYYVRTIKKNGALEAKEDACVACAS